MVPTEKHIDPYGSAGGRRQARWLVAAGLAAVLAAAVAILAFKVVATNDTVATSDAIGGSFHLTAGDGRKVSDADFRGKWLLVYFGYTHCPDICPATLSELSQTLDILGTMADQVQPLFITVDPQRDTAEVMKDYVQSLDPRIVALSGSDAEIAAAARAYRVFYQKRPGPSPDDRSYLMEHTAFVYVMAPGGKYLTLLSPAQGQTPQEMAAKLRDLIHR